MPHDILADPSQYYLVQFNLTKTKHMQPLHLTTFRNFISDRHPESPFVAAKGSMYGVRRVKGATHWGIVHVTDTSTSVLHYGSLNAITRKKRIQPFANGTEYFLVLQGSPSYFKVMVSTLSEFPRTTTKAAVTS